MAIHMGLESTVSLSGYLLFALHSDPPIHVSIMETLYKL